VIALICQPFEAFDAQRRLELLLRSVEILDAHLEIDHVLGGHSGGRRAADVFDPQRGRAKRRPQPRDQSAGSRDPRIVVRLYQSSHGRHLAPTDPPRPGSVLTIAKLP